MRDVQGEAVQLTMRDDLHLTVERYARRRSIPSTPHILLRTWKVPGRYLFTDAVVQESSWARRPAGDCQWIVQVGFLPGVTDNVGRTAAEALEDIYGPPCAGGGLHLNAVSLRGCIATPRGGAGGAAICSPTR